MFKYARRMRDEGGHVAVIFALSIMPIAAIAGFAIDYQMLTTKKNRAQYTLDAAVISGARLLQTGATKEEVSAEVRAYFRAGLQGSQKMVDCDRVEVVVGDVGITADVSCKQKTTLSTIAGINTMPFSVDSASAYGVKRIEVSFVFDVSGSMSGDRIEDLRDAAEAALDQLLPEGGVEEGTAEIFVSMVAYNDSLNAGDYFEDATGRSPNQSVYYYSSYYNRWYRIDYTSTCVFEREGDEAFTDAAPGDGQYITPADYYYRNSCSNSKPLALTNDRDDLDEYVEDLNADGGTAGHLGVAWGWYMISPYWTDVLPEDPIGYREGDFAKVLILMTDGDFNTEAFPDQGSSAAQARDLCDNIRKESIAIYTVAFQAPTAGEQVLSYCATNSDFYFDPQNGEELKDAYRTIATNISDLRLTQ